jgi:hypothetical protein
MKINEVHKITNNADLSEVQCVLVVVAPDSYP